jgi:uncharacterized membrane protein YuzA (DUF378 family)
MEAAGRGRLQSSKGDPEMATARSRPSAVSLTATGLFLVLALTSILSPRGLTWDEPLQLAGARLLVSGGSLGDLLHAALPEAPGPLFAVLHWMLYPLTHFNPHILRTVNLLLFLVAIVFEFQTLRALKVLSARPLALATVAVPMVWVSAGMALTEMPAIAMMSVAVYLAADTLRRLDDGPSAILPRAVLAGLFFSLAVLGRQVYLVLIVVPLAGALLEKRLRSAVLCFVPIALAAPLFVFVTWGGLVRPSQQATIVGSGSLLDALLAVAYLAICVVILAPTWFASLRAWRMPALVAISVGAVNFLVIRVQFGPLGRLQGHLPSPVRTAYPLIGGSALMVICVMFLMATYSNIRDRHNDMQFIVIVGSTALMIATTAAISHFSSQYVVTALPFLVLMLYPYFRANRVTALRMIVGGAIGFASLASYLWF